MRRRALVCRCSPWKRGETRVGDVVSLRTASDIVVDGVLIRAGAPARGVVSRAVRPGRIRGRAQLAIEVESVTRPDGSLLRVSATIAPAPRVGRTFPPPEQHLSIMLGMSAGYGTAAMMAKHSEDTETIARAGVIAGLATGLAAGILQRGEELVLRSGQTVRAMLVPGR